MRELPLLLRYRDRLGLADEGTVASLGEGDTPLVPSRRLGLALGLSQLYFKLESTNPTGSYKDRFAAALLTAMRAQGQRVCLATSSGNTGASLCAYAARYGLRCLLFVNEAVPDGKLWQILSYGQPVFRVRGFGREAATTARVFEHLAAVAGGAGAAVGISAYRYAPAGMDGVKTLAYELVEQLGKAPDRVFVPVGGGGLLTAVGRGFADLQAAGVIRALPRLHAVQPEGNDTVVTPLRQGAVRARSCPQGAATAVSGLAVPVNIDGDLALAALRACGGSGHLVTDEAIWAVQQTLAREEGLSVEPAGAASVAGLLAAHRAGGLRGDEVIVCLLTGHGLKDLSALERIASRPVPLIDQEQLAAVVHEETRRAG